MSRVHVIFSTRGEVAILDLGERFWKPGSQHRGRLRPCAQPEAVLGVGVGGIRPSRLGGRGVLSPENF